MSSPTYISPDLIHFTHKIAPPFFRWIIPTTINKNCPLHCSAWCKCKTHHCRSDGLSIRIQTCSITSWFFSGMVSEIDFEMAPRGYYCRIASSPPDCNWYGSNTIGSCGPAMAMAGWILSVHTLYRQYVYLLCCESGSSCKYTVRESNVVILLQYTFRVYTRWDGCCINLLF